MYMGKVSHVSYFFWVEIVDPDFLSGEGSLVIPPVLFLSLILSIISEFDR